MPSDQQVTIAFGLSEISVAFVAGQTLGAYLTPAVLGVLGAPDSVRYVDNDTGAALTMTSILEPGASVNIETKAAEKGV